ncbi:uncharacterized protein LOC128226814 [Mya arenaria]|uniref:uncharacterized protein LOC128226814 n=1 Tax=Mya arenaria TaxID=6604 RepID=UPI0022E07D3E|nr:uncharacterized protein LOC128226814 [Mya arenaria]
MRNIIGTGKLCFYTDMCNKNVSGDGSEIKCGRLNLIQEHKGKKLKVQVFVRVYRNSFEHFLVLYKDNKFSLQSGYISLKNCLVSKCTGKETQFRVTLNDYEGTGVVFESSNRKEADEWQEALQSQIVSSSPPMSAISPSLSPVIPRSPLMPTVTEESDEES